MNKRRRFKAKARRREAAHRRSMRGLSASWRWDDIQALSLTWLTEPLESVLGGLGHVETVWPVNIEPGRHLL